jgi:3D (Asp-Asp-Asp) domain-containing protein
MFVVRRAAVLVAVVVGAAPAARADTSKLAKEDVSLQPKTEVVGRDPYCCGYPLAENLGFKLRFYWLAREGDFDETDEVNGDDVDAVDLYTRDGMFIGAYSYKFAWHLRMEGSGLLLDGRVLNTHGNCEYGLGKCFETLDVRKHPFGRGAGQRPLVPFKSVAVDPKVVPIGEPIYIPELDGLALPDGTVHDGCVRGDDTGGGIKKRKMDFFVVSYANFRFLLDGLWGVDWMTPHIESPRCEYMRDRR